MIIESNLKILFYWLDTFFCILSLYILFIYLISGKSSNEGAPSCDWLKLNYPNYSNGLYYIKTVKPQITTINTERCEF